MAGIAINETNNWDVFVVVPLKPDPGVGTNQAEELHMQSSEGKDVAVNTQRKSHVHSQRGGGCLGAKMTGLSRNQTYRRLNFGLLAPRTVRKWIHFVLSHEICENLLQQP